jgi:hypothetical protein
MEEDRSTYHIPVQAPPFTRPAAYAFAESKIDDIYQELTAISEEIKQCRSKVLQDD